MTSDKIHVPQAQLAFARLMRATSGFWEQLGNLETRILRSELEGTRIESPIYVTGLARAGTTIVTELLESHPDATSLRYSDFPPVWTPYWWNALRSKLPLPRPEPAERAHGDRIRVTPDSPEAVEEVLWMHFFPSAHEPGAKHVLDEATENPAFEGFYRDHVRKLLKVRGAKRYIAKGNYNLSRMAYIRKLFPDARFVVLLRRPEWHIASLMKQDRLFREQHALQPKVTEYLQLLGHYEFGVHKHPINVGDDEAVRKIMAAWRSERPVAGWAHYWAMLYAFLARQLSENRELAGATLLVPYEQLCDDSVSWMSRMLRHCGLASDAVGDLRANIAGRLTPPTYYQPNFSDVDMNLINELTQDSYRRILQMAQ